MGFKCDKKMEKTYGMATVFDFGKYKGYSVGGILHVDPKYILWAIDNVKEFKPTHNVTEALKELEYDFIGFDPTWDIYMK